LPFGICLRLREMLPTRSPQTLVISAQAAFLSVRSKPRPEAPEYRPFRMLKKIELHGEKPMLRSTLGPVANDNLFRVVGSYNRFGAIPVELRSCQNQKGLERPQKTVDSRA
jgi:hypothetical protein